MNASKPEVEDKYDVSTETSLPDLTTLPGVSAVEPPVEHALEATYFDTDDLRLAAAGITLRRRTGGSDPGWHLKLPTTIARYEVHVRLGRATKTVPKQLRDLVPAFTRGAPMSPVATIRTSRTMHLLLDRHGVVLAEAADDRVTAAASADGEAGTDATTWREWEVELVEGDRAVLAAAADLFRKHGVARSTSPSKLVRVLDGRIPDRPSHPFPAKKSAPAAKVAQARLFQQVSQLYRHDPLVRADAPDAVHKMRVATRRLRSALATLRPVLQRELTDPVRAELKWLATALGEARDAEVLHQRLDNRLSQESAEAVRGPVRTRVRRELVGRYREARERCLQLMTSERYFALLDRLDELAAEPPWTENAERRTRDVLPRRVHHDWKRLKRRVGEAAQSEDPAERARQLHEVRKAAKRARYAAEMLVPAYGKEAKRFVKAHKRIQSALGDHQDSILTQAELRRLADQIAADGGNAFTLGVLHAREDVDQQDATNRTSKAWRRASGKKLRRWTS